MATGYAVAFLGERHGSGIDLGTKEIIEAGPAGTVGPLVGGMLVGPSSVAAILLDHFEDSVHAQVAVRVDRRAILGGVAGQVVGIDAAATIDLGEVYVDFLIVRSEEPACRERG